MPASPSRNPSAEGSRRSYGVVIALAALFAIVLVLLALPASLATRFFPSQIQASDITGTIWHGSAGRLTARNQDAGSLEWRLHPFALLRGRLACDVHWVKAAFFLDGTLSMNGSGFDAENVRGGGTLDDLAALNPGRGWQGDVSVVIERLVVKNDRFENARGTIRVERLRSAQMGGTDIGNYALIFGDDAVKEDGSALAHVEDRGASIEVRATLNILPSQQLANLSGTIKERGQLPEALHRDLDNIAQLRGRDPEGRIPMDLEFAL